MFLFLKHGPAKHNKYGPFNHNIWALAVTTLATKVSTRYIHSPLRWIRHISPSTLEINEQQIIYGKHALCWITGARAHGDLYRRLATQIMHGQHLQSDRWLTLRHVWACVWLHIKMQLPFVTSFPPLIFKKITRKTWASITIALCFHYILLSAFWKMCYLSLLTHFDHCWNMYWLYLLRLSQQREVISRDGISQSGRHILCMIC